MKRQVPNPGSEVAKAIGCTCAIIDNHHGEGAPYPNGPRFWVSGNCDVHRGWHPAPRDAGRLPDVRRADEA